MAKITKIEKRVAFILSHKEALKAARCPESGSPTNAARRSGMSGGGWGYWAQAFKRAGVPCSAQNYWSGSLPTPSTAINKGIAEYIGVNAPADIK